MFIDWLSVTQEFPFDLPVVSDVINQKIDAYTGEVLAINQPRLTHEGSYSSSITITVRGRCLTVEGNPSRINRTDNLWGYTAIGQCIAVYNDLLVKRGLPCFTKCCEVQLRDGASGAKPGDWVADGAVITMIHLTTNVGIGKGNQLDYLRGLSSVRYGRLVAFLFPNGRSVSWTTQGGDKGARLRYFKVYDKAFEIEQNLLPKMRREFGPGSAEVAYAEQLRDYCLEHGVVRFEQELKSEFLARQHLRYWGLFDERRFEEMHGEFLALDSRLKVTAMDLASISDQLLLEKVVDTPKAARTTASYALEWATGGKFDFNKRQVKEHAARLNQIGIDIRQPFDVTRNSLVFVREAREVIKTFDLVTPNWYRRPAGHLQLVAA